MHVNAHLDLDVVAVETADDITTLVELTAPAATADTTRQPATLVVVLDRSGSMAGERLEGAKRALVDLVARLDPTDSFGLVVFDDQVDVVVPAQPLADKDAVRQSIRAVHAGGSTNLSGGFLRGVQEARRAAAGAGATVIVVSDGHANAGIVEHEPLRTAAQTARRAGITTTTLGFGLGYDEELLAVLADSGAGEALFVEGPDTAAKLLAEQVDGLLSLATQATTLRIVMQGAVHGVNVLGGLPTQQLADGAVLVELGDLYAGETRKLCLRFHVPGMAALGLATVAELVVEYDELPSFAHHTVTLPVVVNVVPGDEAAGRVPNAVVVTEAAFLEAQESKRLASEALRRGDRNEAMRHLDTSGDILGSSLPLAAADLAREVTNQLEELRSLREEIEFGDVSRASKASMSSYSQNTRRRGRSQR